MSESKFTEASLAEIGNLLRDAAQLQQMKPIVGEDECVGMVKLLQMFRELSRFLRRQWIDFSLTLAVETRKTEKEKESLKEAIGFTAALCRIVYLNVSHIEALVIDWRVDHPAPVVAAVVAPAVGKLKRAFGSSNVAKRLKPEA